MRVPELNRLITSKHTLLEASNRHGLGESVPSRAQGRPFVIAKRPMGHVIKRFTSRAVSLSSAILGRC